MFHTLKWFVKFFIIITRVKWHLFNYYFSKIILAKFFLVFFVILPEFQSKL